MYRRLFAIGLVCSFLGVANAFAQNKDDDIPAEVRAKIRLHTTTLKTSKSAKDRQRAALELGELGSAASPARRDLCNAMMDSSRNVATAAADSLRKIDEGMYKLATAILLNGDMDAVKRAEQLGPSAEPLTPLILNLARKKLNDPIGGPGLGGARGLNSIHFDRCLAALFVIAANDPAVNRFEIAALSPQSPGTHSIALKYVRKCTDVKQAIKPLISIANGNDVRNQIEAISILAEIADVSNMADIRKALEKLRLTKDAKVRAAVERALEKLNE
jgi:hypothetical protein